MLAWGVAVVVGNCLLDLVSPLNIDRRSLGHTNFNMDVDQRLGIDYIPYNHLLLQKPRTLSNSDSDSGASFDSLDFPELVKPNARIVKLNQEVIDGLQAALKHNPEMNLLAIFPKNYSDRRRGRRRASTAGGGEYKKLPPPPPIRPPAPLG